MLRRINSVLPELILEMILYGIIIEAAGVWLVEDKILFSIGLWVGVATAMGMAVHMAVVIEDAVSVIADRKQERRIIMHSLLRYGAVVVVFFALAVFHLGDVIACFIGVMGLKVSAYLQPFTHRFILKLRGNKEISPEQDVE